LLVDRRFARILNIYATLAILVILVMLLAILALVTVRGLDCFNDSLDIEPNRRSSGYRSLYRGDRSYSKSLKGTDRLLSL
jgi:hypothetical protein